MLPYLEKHSVLMGCGLGVVWDWTADPCLCYQSNTHMNIPDQSGSMC